MSDPVASFDDLFRRLGGYASVAEILGLAHPSATFEMRRRKSIPVRHWPILIARAHEKNVALDEAELVRLHTAPTTTEHAA